MKKLFVLCLLTVFIFTFGCAVKINPSADIPEKSDTSTPDSIDLSQEPPEDEISAPADVPTPKKIYTVLNTVSAEAEQNCKAWMDSLGGLPGFTLEAVYDEASDSYEIKGGMGAVEAVESVEIGTEYIKIIFRDYVKLHFWMTSIPDYLTVNSTKKEMTTPDGEKYTATVYLHHYTEVGVFGEENGKITLTLGFDSMAPEAINDFFISCGKVD